MSSLGIITFDDDDGNIRVHNTNRNSILISDSNGNIKNLSFPQGLITPYYNKINPNNPDLPPGWSLCDGSNGTPDLRGRFILGAGTGVNPSNAVFNPNGILTTRILGQKGGAESVTLSEKEIPSHSHEVAVPVTKNYADWGASNRGNSYMPSPGNNSTGYTGGGQPHNNMPPYYVLCYICFTGINL